MTPAAGPRFDESFAWPRAHSSVSAMSSPSQ
jgi:hypothetical protein